MNRELMLEGILEGYAVETPAGNDLKVLQKWIERYPQFSEELMDFAAARAEIKYSPEPEISAEEEERFREIALTNLHFFLGQKKAGSEKLSSLTKLAEQRGLNKAGLASVLNISLSLVMYLEKKRLRFASIPKEIISNLAGVLETGENLIADYLNQQPDLATNASFKSQTRPEEVPQKDFAEAVGEDPSLTEERKAELIAMSKK